MKSFLVIKTNKARTSFNDHLFLVSCIIMQTGLGAGLNVASTCYWNKATDYSFAYRWESKAVIAIVNVFAIALQ